MVNHAVLRIAREISQIERGDDLSLAVACHESDVSCVRALIVGPMSTPYQFGFYEFMVTFPKEYPTEQPIVRALTTDGGCCRFNPNISSKGGICLSIIGTYAGRRGEQWSSAQCLESILVSIQSLMSENPYLNEPGYDKIRSEEDLQAMKSYTAKVRHENLRLAVIEPLESLMGVVGPDAVAVAVAAPDLERARDPASVIDYYLGDYDNDEEKADKEARESGIGLNAFNDQRKRMFLWYFECYMQTITQGQAESTHHEEFALARFELRGDRMAGRFDYPDLRNRLIVLKDTVMAETESWSVDWTSEKKTGKAHCLQCQYEQVVNTLQREKDFSIDVHLDNGNPFVWNVTYFGRPMTPLDGGTFNIKMHMSPQFPDEQPRAFIDPVLFHYRVSPTGIICYNPVRAIGMQHHIEAIMAALESESPFDPRATVNPEATRLFYGSPADRKLYNRKQRRSAEKSME